MSSKYAITENPFYILHASPKDKEHRLIEKATEQKLLLGIDTDEALQELLHPQGRPDAEIAWLPRMSEGETERVRDYIASDGTEEFPDIAGSCAIARLNAVNTFLENWPAEADCRSAEAAFLSILGILKEITAENVMEDVNADRKESGMAEVSHFHFINVSLREHIDGILSQMGERCQKLTEEGFSDLRFCLAMHYSDSEDPLYRSAYIDRLVNDVLSHRELAEKEKCLRDIDKEISAFRIELARIYVGELTTMDKIKKANENQKRFTAMTQNIIRPMEKWGTMTAPERMLCRTKGFSDKETDAIFDRVLNLSADLWNQCGDRKDAILLTKSMLYLFPEIKKSKMSTAESNLEILKDKAPAEEEKLFAVLSRKFNTEEAAEPQKETYQDRKNRRKALPVTGTGIAGMLLVILFGAISPAAGMIALVLSINGIVRWLRFERKGIGWAAGGTLLSLFYIPFSMRFMMENGTFGEFLAMYYGILIAVAVIAGLVYLSKKKKINR